MFINILMFQFSQRAPDDQAPRRALAAVMSSPLLVTKQEIELSTMNPLSNLAHADAASVAVPVHTTGSADPHINQLQQYGRTMMLASTKGKSLKVKRPPRQFGVRTAVDDGDTESDVAEASPRATFRAEFMPSTVKTRNTAV